MLKAAIRSSSGKDPNLLPLRLARYRQSTRAFSGEAIRKAWPSPYQS
jgi:hypothetical protein